jgi:hypothetical protein
VDFINRLRILAREVSHFDDLREYLWGLLCHTIFVSHIYKERGKEAEHDRAMLFGSVICRRLDEWGGRHPWPPEEWKVDTNIRKVIT